MTIDEKVRKTLAELGVTDARRRGSALRRSARRDGGGATSLISRGAASESEREKLCKDLRDRWLARKNGMLSFVDENWLKTASKELKPIVGRQFNALRKSSASARNRGAGTGCASSERRSACQPGAHSLREFATQLSASVTREVPSRPHSSRQPAAARLAASRHADAARN